MSTFSKTAPLSDAQIAQYYREGYLVVAGLVPVETIERVVAVVPTAGTNGKWTPVTFTHTDPERDAPLHRLLIEPNIVGAVEQIFEAPARVFYGMLAVVPAHGGHGLPWHQDNQYSQILTNALNVFVALCDITPDKAILWVAPGSHRKGVQPAKGSDLYGGSHREAVVEPENGFALPGMRRGDVCIFDRSTYHRSLRNETDEPRFAYAAQYMADYARMAESGEKDPIRMRATELAERIGGLV